MEDSLEFVGIGPSVARSSIRASKSLCDLPEDIGVGLDRSLVDSSMDSIINRKEEERVSTIKIGSEDAKFS